MTSPQEKAEWRSEFERLGEMQVYDNAKQGAIYNNEKKRRFAFVRLVEQERLRRDHDAQVFCYARWTFLAAVAAVIVGGVGIVEGVIVTRCARLSADKLRSAATPTASCAAGRRTRPGNDRPRHWLWICSVGDGRACGTHYHQCKRALRTPRPPSIGLIKKMAEKRAPSRLAARLQTAQLSYTKV